MKPGTVFYKISVILQGLLYSLAGLNHFINPSPYKAMIPPYFLLKTELNLIVGVVELVLGISLLFWKKQRKWVVYGIILLLIGVLPAHIYHLQMDGNIPGFSLVIPVWGAWIRIFMQLILILWIWSVRKIH